MTTNNPWLQHLAAQGARFNAAGDLVEFDASGSGVTALVPLVHLGTLQVSGDDATTLLHNLLSNDIKKLGPNNAQHSSFNSPKGRMLASFLIWRNAEGFRLQLSADLAAAMAKKLSMYVLRTKAKIADVTPLRATIGLLDATPAMLEAAELPVPAQDMVVAHSVDGQIDVIRLDEKRLFIEAPQELATRTWSTLASMGAKQAGSNDWLAAQIHAGIPLVTATTQDEFVAQMLNFELLGGVDFKKGCYPGQEIVARTQYLGKLKKRMYLAHVDTDVPVVSALDLYSPDFGTQSCGKIVNVARAATGGCDLLAVMQISAFESTEVHIGAADGAKLVFAEQPYMID